MPSVCIVTSECVGLMKNGGIGTSMTGLAEQLAASGCTVTILYTGDAWRSEIPQPRWAQRYASLGITLIAIPYTATTGAVGPLVSHGIGVPFLVYQFLSTRHFDVVHFNDCGGEGSLCLAAKKFGLAFQETLLLVALHGPSHWVLELNQSIPASVMMSACNHAERLSVRAADVLWSPSSYLLDWAAQRDFGFPEQTFVQQYCLPTSRLAERDRTPAVRPDVKYGRTMPPKRIVFFGRLEERKGLRLFCNAIHALRHELADRAISVAFLGRAQSCEGMSSLDYLARRSREWRFPTDVMSDLGQPEAIAYLRREGNLAVMPARFDNSPCTVYEALALGIPFLAARTGGVPELIHEADRDAVLFECTTPALVESLRAVLGSGGWIARPSRSQVDVRCAWSSFHSNWQSFLPEPNAGHAAPLRVVAIIDATRGSGVELRATMASIGDIAPIDHVIVLNRDGSSVPPHKGTASVRIIDLLLEDPEALDNALAAMSQEVVLMLHAGITVRADAFAESLRALSRTDVDGLQPAATVAGKRSIVPPLGGDPAFALFAGATFTGGLLVRSDALRRATAQRQLTAGSAFMGLADLCVTNESDIWPYPEAVFQQPVHWIANGRVELPLRVMAYAECSATDRYYMLAAGYERRGPGRRVISALLGLGLGSLVPWAVWVFRNVRGIPARLRVGSIGRRWQAGGRGS